MNTAIKLHSFNYTNYRTYLFSLLFIAGNTLLPQLAHLIPQGGFIFLPIYFFTLIAAYKYGIAAGLLTAVLSPLANHWLFGMPPAAVLPVLLIKSVILAIAAAWAARYYKTISIFSLLIVVLSYQVAGTLVEWGIVKNLSLAIQDFRIGFPGMLLQVFGGYFLLRTLAKY